MTQEDRRALVALSLIPGLGPARIRSLLKKFGSPNRLLKMSPSRLVGVPGIGRQTARSIWEFDGFNEVDRQFRAAEQVGARLLVEEDCGYPELLKQIYDPPIFLWIRGELTDADRRTVAIVGTRRATSYGRHIAGVFAADLVRYGFTIVSGLAYGIDTASHRGAIEAGGRSIGILGSGIDRIYPGSNRGLANRMIDSGALLSEYAPGSAPDAPNFPRRNRIISGMCLGVIIVEAFEQGGALITARLAVEQNREVFAVPSPISRPDGPGSGCNRLIQEGHAKLVMSAEDVLVEFPRILESTIAASASVDWRTSAERATPELSGEEEVLWNVLEYSPIHLDTICAKSELDPSTALVHLLNLEFRGLVRQMAGKQFVRN